MFEYDKAGRSKRNPVLIAGALVTAALAVGTVPRLLARSTLAQQTEDLSVPAVSVVTPKAGSAVQTLDLPANVQPFQDVAIFARTSGYVAHWYVDIGTQVTAGQLLAVIASPEVDAELAQAKATAASAAADYGIAKITAERWQQLLKTNAVSQQEAEQDTALMRARGEALTAARANVNRLTDLQSFERIQAPFTGIVTARGIDTGNLIDSGSAGGPRTEMYHLMQTDMLRVFADVPQDSVRDATVGTKATLTLSQWPDRKFDAAITRTAGAIDPVTRTLRVELDVPNPDGALLPGAYAILHLHSTSATPRISIPVSALVFRPEGVEVATVNAANRVSLQSVKLGRDFGATVEVLSGLDGRERVIANPNDGIASGDAVRVATENNHA
jgi:membrane fusion protein, multidrug efflux system